MTDTLRLSYPGISQPGSLSVSSDCMSITQSRQLHPQWRSRYHAIAIVRMVVMRLTEPTAPPSLPGVSEELATQPVQWPDLVDYDRLLGGGRKQ